MNRLVSVLLVIPVVLVCLQFASYAESAEVIRGRVVQVTGSLQPGDFSDRSPEKAEVAPNVVVYAVDAAELEGGSITLQSTVLRLIENANAYAVTNAKGEYVLNVSPGKLYRIIAVIGPAVRFGVSDGSIDARSRAKAGEIVIDARSH
jgi:hypothetical protein